MPPQRDDKFEELRAQVHAALHTSPHRAGDTGVMVRGFRRAIDDAEIVAAVRVLYTHSRVARLVAPLITTWFISSIR